MKSTITKIIFAFIILFFLFQFLFNLRYLSRFFDWDSVIYVLNTETSMFNRNKSIQKHLGPVFYNPHHIGFESSGYAYLRWIRSFYPEYDSMFILRLRNLSWSFIFLIIFIYLHHQLYRRLDTAFLLGLAISVSEGYWWYSHHYDSPMFAQTSVALTFLVLLYFMKNGFSKRAFIILGVVQVASVYLHQSNAIFLLLVPFTVLFSQKYRSKVFTLGEKLRSTFVYLFVVVLILTISYLFVGFYLLQRDLESKNEKHFTNWLFLYVYLERWGASKEKKDYITHFYRGIGDAFLNFQGVRPGTRVDFSKAPSVKNLPYNLNVAFWGLILFLFLINIRRVFKRYGPDMSLLLIWLIPSIIFYTWWEGYYLEFWLSTTISLWMFSFYVLDSLPWDAIRNSFRAVTNVLYLGMILMLFSVNFTYSTMPRSERVVLGYIHKYERYRRSVERMAREKVYRYGPITLPQKYDK